jgi:hypothetical protein
MELQNLHLAPATCQAAPGKERIEIGPVPGVSNSIRNETVALKRVPCNFEFRDVLKRQALIGQKVCSDRYGPLNHRGNGIGNAQNYQRIVNCRSVRSVADRLENGHAHCRASIVSLGRTEHERKSLRVDQNRCRHLIQILCDGELEHFQNGWNRKLPP